MYWGNNIDSKMNEIKSIINRAKTNLANYTKQFDGVQWDAYTNEDADSIDVDFENITLTVNRVDGVLRVPYPQTIDIWDDDGFPITSLTINEKPA